MCVCVCVLWQPQGRARRGWGCCDAMRAVTGKFNALAVPCLCVQCACGRAPRNRVEPRERGERWKPKSSSVGGTHCARRLATPTHPPPLQAKTLLTEATTILTDDLDAWKPMLDHAAGYTFGAGANSTSALCTGPSCAQVAAMLPLLQFKAKKALVQCPETFFKQGACFAPGCAPCDPSCPVFQGGGAFLLTLPGPLGTGLFCNGCQPCCQKVNDPNRKLNSTCMIV